MEGVGVITGAGVVGTTGVGGTTGAAKHTFWMRPINFLLDRRGRVSLGFGVASASPFYATGVLF